MNNLLYQCYHINYSFAKCSNLVVKNIYSVLLFQYVNEFAKTQLLARKLAHYCCKRLGNMCQENALPLRTQSPVNNTSTNTE